MLDHRGESERLPLLSLSRVGKGDPFVSEQFRRSWTKHFALPGYRIAKKKEKKYELKKKEKNGRQ